MISSPNDVIIAKWRSIDRAFSPERMHPLIVHKSTDKVKESIALKGQVIPQPPQHCNNGELPFVVPHCTTTCIANNCNNCRFVEYWAM